MTEQDIAHNQTSGVLNMNDRYRVDLCVTRDLKMARTASLTPMFKSLRA